MQWMHTINTERKKNMQIKGLKITDIMNMSWDDLNSLSGADLRKITGRLVSASNKRIRRLEQTSRGKSSFAYQKVEERGRKFSTRGLNTNQVRTEFANARRFLKMKTSTVKGWNEYRSSVEERLTKTLDVDELGWSEKTESKFWKVYRRFEEQHGGKFKKGDSDQIQQMLTEMFESSDKRRSVDYFTERIDELYSDYYEQEQEEHEDVSDVFSFGENKLDM